MSDNDMLVGGDTIDKHDLVGMAKEVADLLEAGETPPLSKEHMVRVLRHLADVLEMAEELERQRAELLAVLEDVRKCKSLYSMWRGRNKSKTYGAIIDAAIAAARKEQVK